MSKFKIYCPNLRNFVECTFISSALNLSMLRGCTKRRPCAPLSTPKKERLLELSADDDSNRRTILEYFCIAKKECILELR